MGVKVNKKKNRRHFHKSIVLQFTKLRETQALKKMGFIRPFDALIPKETPPEKRVWEEPDPRIQWALDILEPPGEYAQLPERIGARFFFPFFGMSLGQFGVFLNNISRKLPVRSNLVGYVVASGLGITIGEYVRYKLYEYKAEELATIKHYIMLHPEKFPEPEPMKYGDKRVFYPWIPNRRPGIG